jgi:hypothetical protein
MAQARPPMVKRVIMPVITYVLSKYRIPTCAFFNAAKKEFRKLEALAEPV